MSNGDDEARGKMKATLEAIQTTNKRIEETLNHFIESTVTLRLKCHERMTRNESALSYISEIRKNKIPTIVAIIAFFAAIGSLWVAFAK